MKKEIEAIKKSQEKMNNPISELKNTVKGIKSMLSEADQISKLEDKVEKKTQTKAKTKSKKRKRGSERMKRD